MLRVLACGKVQRLRRGWGQFLPGGMMSVNGPATVLAAGKLVAGAGDLGGDMADDADPVGTREWLDWLDAVLESGSSRLPAASLG